MSAQLSGEAYGALRQAIFRSAAAAFWLASSVALISDYIGPGLHVNYPAVWALAALAFVGGAVSWFLPWTRLPTGSFYPVILGGVVLIGLAVLATGGVQTHLLVLFVVPTLFAAALLNGRYAAITAALSIALAIVPVALSGWSGLYGRSLMNLVVVLGIAGYIPARVRFALEQESARRQQDEHENYVATIRALASALDAKDRYTEAHSRETAALAVLVGQKLGLARDDLQLLEFGALLHDIGKIGIPGYVLNKPGPLNQQELAIMREHPVIGERILASVPRLASVRPIVRAEHERWDGGGYPDGLAGEAIPLAARIIHACDAYHAMATDRPYRPALSSQKIVDELRQNAGAQFDPDVATALLKIIQAGEWLQHNGAEAAALEDRPAGRSHRWEQHLEAIEALGDQLARATDVQAVCDIVGKAVAGLVEHDQCRILLLSEDRKTLVPGFISEVRRQEYADVTAAHLGVKVGEGISGWVAQTKRGVVIGDAERHPRARHVPGSSYIDESMVVVPVVFEEELLGEIVVLKVGLNQYSNDDLRLLAILANQAAASIAHARLISELRNDPLTGLASRRTFEERLMKCLGDRARPFSLVMVDVDRLKEVNDTEGHGSGDLLLKAIADAIRNTIRPIDLAGRWGGDEFLILMPQLEDLAARATAQELRNILWTADGDRRSIAISFGVASYPEDGATADALVAAADRSMYRDKRRRTAA